MEHPSPLPPRKKNLINCNIKSKLKKKDRKKKREREGGRYRKRETQCLARMDESHMHGADRCKIAFGRRSETVKAIALLLMM